MARPRQENRDAAELAARLSTVDLTDGPIDAGEMNDFSVGSPTERPTNDQIPPGNDSVTGGFLPAATTKVGSQSMWWTMPGPCSNLGCGTNWLASLESSRQCVLTI